MPPLAEIAQRDVGIEEGANGRHQQLDQREREQHRDAPRSASIRDELDDQLLAVGAEHLAQRHLAGALAGAGGGEVGEVHHRHAEDQQGDDREGAIVRRSLPGVIAPSWALPRWTSRTLTKCQSSSSPGL
jgi:hypothetical protein